MKKVLVVMLVLALVLSMSGMALAKPAKFKSRLSVIPIDGGGVGGTNVSSITQKASITNVSAAYSGPAIAVGNVGVTVIEGVNSSASSCSGCATNNANITVNNEGSAEAYSGAATATNDTNNSITQTNSVSQSNSTSISTTICDRPEAAN
ncbi:MAG: hypothetical protein ACYC56_02310 [Candidatus Aquicultor sp.]